MYVLYIIAETPVSLNYEGDTRRNNTILPCQFNDAVAKRAANSFDSFCKGMTVRNLR